MSKKTHKPTDKAKEHVRAMAGVGVSEERIAKYLGICRDTLRKYYKEILDTSRGEGIKQVANALYENAMKGNVTAQIFYLKIQDKWLEKVEDEDKGDNTIAKVQIEVIQPGDIKTFGDFKDE